MRFRNVAAAGLAATVVVTLTGCQQDEPSVPLPTAPPATSASPAPTVDEAEAAAMKGVRTAYADYQRVVAAAQNKGDPKAKDLASYVAEPLLGQIRNSIGSMAKAGFVVKGRTESKGDPEITELNLDDRTPTATIEDCIDPSSAVLTSKKTGKPQPAPSGQPPRYLVVSTAKQVSGKWYIDGTKGYWERPC
ncbi:hypothetical protein ACTI_38000 [Actinoplanes sp. OR16]|uniref:hypothetical protein n=1 Tax=Actinoplanes sp. OR16 TaxID=946334 RepID=UPI000F6D4D06|nr:hypothetical protein [Actinoplanes sp. OR16]BBH67115.1 hypothetical protein ACTI_38000 [Actinoplanes sp. OR16]